MTPLLGVGNIDIGRHIGLRAFDRSQRPIPDPCAVQPPPTDQISGHIVKYPQQWSCYNASEAGVIMLGKSLAAEWAARKIRVNTISPGYMDTALNRVPALDARKVMWNERTPMGRLGNVDELNKLAIFLVSDEST
ncbi:Similar to Sorbose reductase sou1; acc. no. Q9Y6Z9 [Pyronema omphalodes CBS 100304]|uniref:Similar to Sorbose reductase sou1 acc. no. Q9Y6Z9 n=1 Tax=Pyronema omphalodes (strain CBS 100304) TaxID=1076935 RepID=U4LUQ5_PYROM|nr:Similar to Sorbose reductase sou1; acc. no. Q9Y6Z9 [Pyronema omphalodes CBS 100304]